MGQTGVTERPRIQSYLSKPTKLPSARYAFGSLALCTPTFVGQSLPPPDAFDALSFARNLLRTKIESADKFAYAANFVLVAVFIQPVFESALTTFHRRGDDGAYRRGLDCPCALEVALASTVDV